MEQVNVYEYEDGSVVSTEIYLEYFAKNSSIRFELINGRIYAMGYTSGEHSTIVINLSSVLRQHLKGKKCRPFVETIKTYVDDKNYYFPDVVVDCNYNSSSPYVVGMPTVIFEVLSETTRSFDETVKFLNYQKIESLQEYVLIEQGFKKVTVYRKNKNWQNPDIYFEDGIVYLESLGLSIPIDEIYDNVTLRLINSKSRE